jgi:hypothetical protein
MYVAKDAKSVARRGSRDSNQPHMPDELVSRRDLSFRCFVEAANSLADPFEILFQASASCARHMAESAGIALYPWEVQLYCLLRVQRPESFSGISPERGATKDSWQMSDQELLAEILKMTGDKERLYGFCNFYKSIFFLLR